MIRSKYSGIVLDVARQRGGASPGVVTLLDHSRWGNDGAMANVTWVQLPSGLWSPIYNGTTSAVSIPTSDELMPLDAITVMAWVYHITLDASHRLMAKKSTAFGIEGWCLSFHSGVRFYTSGGVQAIGAALNTGRWYFVVGTFDRTLATNQVKVYVQGIENAVAINANPLVSSTQPVVLGTTLDGNMVLNRVYNYGLTPAQVRSIFSATRRLFGV